MTQTQPRPTAEPANPESVFERVTALTISLGAFGNSRKVPSSLINVDADKAWLRISKRLLDAPELDAIQRFDRNLRDTVAGKSLPLPMFRGSYAVPNGAVLEVDEYLRNAAPERATLVASAKAAYPQRIREAAAALRRVFDPGNYLSVERFAASYFLEWRWVEIGTPGKLANISIELFRAEKQKAARYFSEAADLYRQVLRESLIELLEHARERLEPGPDGKPKVFRNSMIGNLNAFFDTFAMRNVTDDRQLAGIVDQMRKLVSNVEAQDLRSDEKLRGAIAKELGAIEQSMTSMIVAKPTRRIVVED